MINIKEIDYLVINCGQTQILKDYLQNLVNYDLQNMPKYQYGSDEQKKEIKKYIDDFLNIDVKPLFLYDNVLGEGMSVFSDDENIKNPIKILTDNKMNICNIVCFKCNNLQNAMKTVDQIIKLKNFGHTNLYEIKYVDKLLYLSYKTTI
ncbi:hypothetical protein Catovirus_1_442 [Catovirus CTV1]|uniref:Uncharacterized protein n=1 Tax=Catovirus CTV1 TaxID=1977631 RepID=A0A1V0S9L3_9VIRU|nr:hypothetical protein Catovirus_1_442 [Catovirus CTV1]